MGDARNPGPQPRPTPPARPSAEELREQQAIAAALLIGEQMRRDDRKHVYWYVKRIGFFLAGFAFFILLMLFAMWRVRQEFNPTVWMLVMAAVGAGGIAAVYWAFTEERRHPD